MDRRGRPSKVLLKKLELFKERKSLEAKVEMLTKRQKEKDDQSNAINLAAKVIIEQEEGTVTAVKPCKDCNFCLGRRDCLLVEVEK